MLLTLNPETVCAALLPDRQRQEDMTNAILRLLKGSEMKRYLQTAWTDIRSGENIDIYLTLLVCLVLVVAGIFGIVDFTVLASGILATLAILATSTLGIRRVAQNLRDVLRESEHRQKLQRHSQIRIDRQKICEAQTLDWMSVSLFKALPMHNFGISECLRNGGQVRILLVDPRNSDVLNALARSGYFFNDPEKMSRDTIFNSGFNRKLAENYA